MPIMTTAEKAKYDTNLDEDQTKAVIREFQTIVEYGLNDEKKVTRAEAIATFKMLPNFDWSKNDNYHVRNTGGSSKLVLVTYFADGAIDEATAGPFFSKEMSLAI